MPTAFISSVVKGMEALRETADDVSRTLGNDVVRAEEFPASPDAPRHACLAAVRSSDVVVIILGPRYGARQESGLSATHEEFREAVDNQVPVLAFVQDGLDREREQDEFIREVQDWAGGVYTAHFTTEDDFRRELTKALHEWELAQAAGPADESEMLARAKELVPSGRGGIALGKELGLVVTGGPRRQVLRPAELESSALQEALQREALFGPTPVLDRTEGTEIRVQGPALVLRQEHASVLVDEQGSVRIVQPARSKEPHDHLPVILEEEVRDRLERALRFVSWTLDEIDDARRLSDVVVVAFLTGASHTGWKRRAEHEKEPNTVQMGGSGKDIVAVNTTPARRNRAALGFDAPRLAEDLTVLLRREVKT